MKLMLMVAVIPLVIYLGVKRNVINKVELFKNIPDILQWLAKVLLAALISLLLNNGS